MQSTASPSGEGREGAIPIFDGASGSLVSDSSQLAAENDLLRQRLAIAERDLAAAKSDAEGERARIAGWQDAFGLHDGVDPKDKVRETIAALDAKTKRVEALQAALGVGEGDDPVAPHPQPLSAGGERGVLPPWGQLLLLTQLAKHHPLLGISYFSSPDVLQEANGDRWMALRQESRGEDGTVGHVVIVQRAPSTYLHEQAQSQKIHYEGELAVALRSRSAVERATGANLPAAAKEAARAKLKEAKARVEEIQAALKSLEPQLVAPKTTEWRFTADLDGLA